MDDPSSGAPGGIPAPTAEDEPLPTDPGVALPGSPPVESPASQLDRSMVRAAARARLFPRQRIPQRLGRYLVLEALGAGASGKVYAAYDPKLDRKVAIKLLRHARDEHDARMLAEARAMAQLSHPNIVQIYDVDSVEHGGQPVVYIAMELVDGATLRAWLEQRAHPTREIVAMFGKIGRGLAAAHAAGLVHRDFKPENVLVARDGRPRVLDFGLVRRPAKAPTHESASIESEAEPGSHDESRESLTRTGTVMGTPAYMAPEQFQGADVDARCDQFAFCVALYEALHAQRPFEGNSVSALAVRVQAGERAALAKPRPLPMRLRRLLDRGLAIDPHARFDSMAELLAELDRVGRRRGWAVLGVGAATLGVAGLLTVDRTPSPCADPHGELEEVWDEPARASLRAALEGSNLGFAARTADTVEQRIDAWAEQWVQSHADACARTLVHRQQSPRMMDLRMACLRRRRGELQAVTRVLGEGRDEAVREAVDLVTDLRSPALCDETEALAAAVEPPDAAIAARVEQQRAVLAEVATRKAAGDALGARSLAEGALAQARALGYRPLLAEAHFHRASIGSELGELDVSEREGIAAFQDALAAGHYEMIAFSATQLVHLLAVLRGRPDDAEPWLGHARAASERLPDHDMAQIRLLQREGTMRLQQRRYDEAAELVRRSCEQATELLGEDHVDVLSCRTNLAFIEVRRGNLDEAEGLAREVLERRLALLGPSHPAVGNSYNLLGNIARARGDAETSLAEYRRSLAVAEAAYGPEHPDVAAGLFNIGNRLREAGRNGEARRHYQSALEIYTKAHGPRSETVATTLNSIALTHQNEGDLDLAVELYDRAIGLLESATGPDREGLGIAHNNVGNILLQLERPDDAIPHYEASLAVLEGELGPDHVFVASPLSGLGDANIALERYDQAAASLARAVAIREAKDDAETPQTRWVLARALWLGDRREQARAHLRRLVDDGSDDTGRARRWLESDQLPDNAK
ncbi:MAG: serine/threonine protein kinase [Myxococcales bacterium]|nr:serine/threonine protein kinase [Myxococcales bacterium]